MATVLDGRPYQIAVRANPDRDADGILITGFPADYLTGATATAPIRVLGTQTAAGAAWSVQIGATSITLSLPQASVAAVGVGQYEWVLLLVLADGSEPAIVGGSLEVSYSAKRTSGATSTAVEIDPIGVDVTIEQTVIAGATTLAGLSDVTITAAASGDILRHNGTAWVDTPGTTHFDAAGTAASAVSAHEADPTSVHGIADTSTLYRSGGTDVAVADGGTGASTAADARTNLGLGTAATISATAGGDLSGTLPSPTVAAINGVTVTGTPSVGYVPTATSSSAATWQAAAGSVGADSIWDTKGDLAAATGADTATKLAAAAGGFLTPDSTVSNGLRWAPTVAAPAVNDYFSCQHASGNTTNAGNYQRVELMPIWVPIVMTVDRIWITVDTAFASSVIRLGIYSADTIGRPGTLLLDAGTVDSSSTGNKEITISQALTPGLYWLAACPQVASTPRYRGITNAVGFANMTTSPNNLTAPNVALVGTSSVTGALPSSLTITYTGGGDNKVPIIALRRSA